MNFDDLQEKTSYELITESGGVDEIIDALVAEVASLRNRVEALENQ